MNSDLRNLLAALLTSKGKPVPGKPELADDVRRYIEAHTDYTLTVIKDGRWLMYQIS